MAHRHGFDERKAGADLASQSSVSAAADHFGVTHGTIRRWLKEFGKTAGRGTETEVLADAGLGPRLAAEDGDRSSHTASDAAAAEASESLIRIAAMCRETQHADAPAAAMSHVVHALWADAHSITGTVLAIDGSARSRSPSHRLVQALHGFRERASVIAQTDPRGEQVTTLADDMERLGNALGDEGRAAIPAAAADEVVIAH